jgi:hypothetical protein
LSRLLGAAAREQTDVEGGLPTFIELPRACLLRNLHGHVKSEKHTLFQNAVSGLE